MRISYLLCLILISSVFSTSCFAPPRRSQQSEIHDEETLGLTVAHLRTFRDHQDHLISSIGKAQNTILITSYNFAAQISSQRDLFEALREASSRGVSIYLYFDHNNLGKPEVRFLNRLRGIQLNNVNMHSKLLVIDSNVVTAGSFEWLGNSYYTQGDINASIALEGEDLEPFVDRIWRVIRSYRAVSANSRITRHIDRRFERIQPEIFQLEGGHEIELVTTPQRHREFFEEAFRSAAHRIVICAPFITGDSHFLESIFPRESLTLFLNSGKRLHIFYRADDERIRLLAQYLSPFRNRTNLVLTPIDRLHLKAFIVDNKCVHGSFNWLTSAGTLEDDYTYMETSLIFSGEPARDLISEFPFPIN